MIPALMVMLLTLICGFLPALNIVSEKEVGTIEQINVTLGSEVYLYFGKALALLVDWFCGADCMFHISLVNLWHSAGRSFSIDLLFRSSFRSGNVRFRTCYFQLLGNDATVYVCYVVLFVGCNFDEWFVYSH